MSMAMSHGHLITLMHMIRPSKIRLMDCLVRLDNDPTKWDEPVPDYGGLMTSRDSRGSRHSKLPSFPQNHALPNPQCCLQTIRE